MRSSGFNRDFTSVAEVAVLTKDEYLAFRREFEPTTVKLVVVAESPPKTGLYFYNPDGEIREPLFSEMMKQRAACAAGMFA